MPLDYHEQQKRDKRADRRILVGFGVFLGALFLGIGILIGWAVHRSNANYAAFMQGCLKDHKQYECMAMWRAGESRDVPFPIFIPIPIPTGR
ncbi:MAG: hypothetical protein JOY71_10560 [Acetobacteraceae bacterium]|nr:hypothetical protein [Acetobacteraceae bacterium]